MRDKSGPEPMNPFELARCWGDALVVHSAGVFGATDGQWQQAGGRVAPFRLGVRDGTKEGRRWVALRVVPMFGRSVQAAKPEVLLRSFAEDLVEQIRRHEVGKPFESSRLPLPVIEPRQPRVEIIWDSLFRTFWREATVGAVCLGSQTWPLVRADRTAGEKDAEVVASLGPATLVSVSNPRPTSRFIEVWSNLLRRIRVKEDSQGSVGVPVTVEAEIGPWRVAGGSRLVVEYNCGQFLLEDHRGIWWMRPQPIVLHVVLDFATVRALYDGVVSPERTLSLVTAPADCHPNVSRSGKICYGGKQQRIGGEFRAAGGKRATVQVLWALLAAARVLKRGCSRGYRSLRESGWQRVVPGAPGLAGLPRYRVRDPLI